MKKLIQLVIMAVGSFGGIEVQAQYVEKVGSNLFVDLHDMPIGTWSTNSLNISHTETNAANSVFVRFEVAKSDEAGNKNWVIAKAACAAKGLGWRLPTQRELQLIYIMKDLLVLMGATPFTPGLYWTSTNSALLSDNAWAVRLDSGFSNTTGLVAELPVRCVRESN